MIFRFGFEVTMWFCWRDHRLRLHLHLGLLLLLLLLLLFLLSLRLFLGLILLRLFFHAPRLFLLSNAHDGLLSVLLAEVVEVGVQAIDEDRLQS